MAKPATVSKMLRKHYSSECRIEALMVAEHIATAPELRFYKSQLYALRSKIQKQKTSSERENELAAESARLKRQLTKQPEELAIIQKKAVAYFVKRLKVTDDQNRLNVIYRHGILEFGNR